MLPRWSRPARITPWLWKIITVASARRRWSLFAQTNHTLQPLASKCSCFVMRFECKCQKALTHAAIHILNNRTCLLPSAKALSLPPFVSLPVQMRSSRLSVANRKQHPDLLCSIRRGFLLSCQSKSSVYRKIRQIIVSAQAPAEGFFRGSPQQQMSSLWEANLVVTPPVDGLPPGCLFY